MNPSALAPRTTAQKEWLTDIAAACEELDYGIMEIEPDRIEMERDGTIVTIRSVFLSGKTLRRVLKAKEEK